MSRTVPEWIGKTDDTPVPPRVKLRIFLRFDGKCQCGCGRKIITGERWELEHKDALCNGGQHRESNLRPFLLGHQKEKTRADVAERSVTYRKRRAHYGVKSERPSFQTNRNGQFRKKMNGEVVRRHPF